MMLNVDAPWTCIPSSFHHTNTKINNIRAILVIRIRTMVTTVMAMATFRVDPVLHEDSSHLNNRPFLSNLIQTMGQYLIINASLTVLITTTAVVSIGRTEAVQT